MVELEGIEPSAS